MLPLYVVGRLLLCVTIIFEKDYSESHSVTVSQPNVFHRIVENTMKEGTLFCPELLGARMLWNGFGR